MTANEFYATLYCEKLEGEMGLIAIKCGKKHYGLIYPKFVRHWIDDLASRASCYPVEEIARRVGGMIANNTRVDYQEHYYETLENYKFDAIARKAAEWIEDNESDYLKKRINDRDTGKLYHDYESDKPVFVDEKKEETEKKIDYTDGVLVRVFKGTVLALADKNSQEHIWHVADVDPEVFNWSEKRILKVFKSELKKAFDWMQAEKNN